MSSKIPVCLENRHPKMTKPKATLGPADNMKREAQKFEFKESAVPPNFNFVSKTETVGVLKPHNNVPRKKPTAKVYKGSSSRVEAELRDQNRLLEALNVDLHKDLSEAKENVVQLEQRYIELQGENNDIQKQLENCLLLLVAGEIDPVLGERIAETTQQNEEQRKDVLNVSKELMNELQRFGEQTAEHRARLEQEQQKMRALKEARDQHLKEWEAFSLEVQEMENALEHAEELLLEEV